VSYVVSFGHDITKRLEAEQALIDHRAHLEEQVRARTAEALVQPHRLETGIEALPVNLTIKDRQGRYQLSNQVFEEAPGTSKERPRGKTARAFPSGDCMAPGPQTPKSVDAKTRSGKDQDSAPSLQQVLVKGKKDLIFSAC